MLLICPHCGTRYNVHPEDWPAQKMAEDGTWTPRSRKVRCKKCQTVWRATPADEREGEVAESTGTLPETLSETLDEPPFAADEEAEEILPAKTAGPVRAFLVATPLLLLLVAGTAFYTATDGLKTLSLPPLTDIGLPALTLPTLDLSWVRLPAASPSALRIATSYKPEKLGDGQLGWQISVQLENPTSSTLEIPPIELRILDAEERTLSRWTVRPRKRLLQPREKWAFETTRVAPPATGHKLVARLNPPALARP